MTNQAHGTCGKCGQTDIQLFRIDGNATQEERDGVILVHVTDMTPSWWCGDCYDAAALRG